MPRRTAWMAASVPPRTPTPHWPMFLSNYAALPLSIRRAPFPARRRQTSPTERGLQSSGRAFFLTFSNHTCSSESSTRCFGAVATQDAEHMVYNEFCIDICDSHDELKRTCPFGPSSETTGRFGPLSEVYEPFWSSQ